MNELDIPIDIAIRKLLDWLVSRRICSRDWHEAAVRIRERIGDAMQDMPENEGMRALLAGAHINYFHCRRIVEILRETEADSKNFFGQYGSKRMKDWTQIISEYESGNVYLAEAAQLLTQLLVYEIPAARKHLQKLQQLQTEADKKEENAGKRIAELEEEFRKQCAQLGVKGDRIQAEIIALARDLPASYAAIAADAAAKLPDAVRLYVDFLATHVDEGVDVRALENLRFLLERGNTTTYEWKYGEKPISVEEPVMEFDEEDENEAQTEIDFGDDDGGEIDFGGDDNGGEIDFGDVEIDFGDSGAELDFGEGAGDIDFDIDSVDTSAIVVEDGGVAGGVARDEEALSILDNRRTRTLLVDELEELAGFLTQRLVEAEGGGRFSFAAGTSSHDPATLRRMVESVERVEAALTELRMQQLQMIRDSPAYAGRLADTLKQKLKLKEKVISSIDDIRRRKAEAKVEEEQGEAELKRLQERTQVLQDQIEQDLSHRYKGRKVNISGK